MKHSASIVAILICLSPLTANAAQQADMQKEMQVLQNQTLKLQAQLNKLQKQLKKQSAPQKSKPARPEPKASATPTNNRSRQTTTQSTSIPSASSSAKAAVGVHSSAVTVHRLDSDPESLEFYPTALLADEHIVTYIAGTPVVASPYLGSRPAFDGSDYIVNISSINRDIRLMQQRRRLYRAYEKIGYPIPHQPIIALSGKVEPLATLGSGDAFFANPTGDLTLFKRTRHCRDSK